MLTLLIMMGNSAWGDSYTITFKTNSGDGSTITAGTTACSDIVSDGSSYLKGKVVTATKAYYNGSSGVKLGTSSDAGVLKMNLKSSITPTSIVVNAKRYNASNAATIAINGKTAQSLTSSFSNYTFTFSSEISYIQLNASKYCWISSITVYYTPIKTATTLTLDHTSLDFTLPSDGAATLTPTVTPAGGVALVSPTISWSSSDETVATVAAGVVTPLKEGSATITASYAGDETYAASNATCSITVSDSRTAVNLSTFTATNTTLIIGGAPNTTTTSVTNDQGGWATTYTYKSSDEDVATVNGSGVITAVAKGTAIITCSLDMDPDDDTYKAGSTSSKTIEITVNKPSHTTSFSINGVIDPADDDAVEEDEDITFPSSPASIGGKVFKGWTTAALAGNQAEAPTILVTSATMSTADITYYAVYANEIIGDDATLTIVPSTTNMPTSYGDANTFTQYTLEGKKFKVQQMYKNGEKLQWRAAGDDNGTGTMYNTDALYEIQSIAITYDSFDTNKNFKVKVGDAENPTSGTSITPTNDGSVYTYDCSSYHKSYFVLTNGQYAGYLTSIVITYRTSITCYSDYCTSVTVPVTIGSAGYTTYVTPYNVSFPDGITGYIATATGASTVTLSEVTNVPADEPIVLKASAGNYNLPVITTATDDVSSNLLNASDGSIVGDGSTIFALGVGKTGTNKDKVGFYLVDNDVSIPEGKAYLTVPAAVKEFLAFSFDQATRVQELCPASSPSRTREEEIIFNLAGQRMSKMQRGVNIVNGKKVVVK